MRKISMDLVQGKQGAIMEEGASGGGPILEKTKERDLLSLMIKSNMATDVPEGQRLSFDQIMHQIPTFIISGLSSATCYSSTNSSTRSRNDLDINNLGYVCAFVKSTVSNEASCRAAPFPSRLTLDGRAERPPLLGRSGSRNNAPVSTY
jgi:hypothetical protein